MTLIGDCLNPDVDELRAFYRKSEPFRALWGLESDFKKADGSPDWSAFDMSLASLLWAWPSEKIAWAIKIIFLSA